MPQQAHLVLCAAAWLSAFIHSQISCSLKNISEALLCIYTYTYTYIDTQLYVYTYVCIHTSIYIYIHMYTYVYTYVCMYEEMDGLMDVCLYVCV